MNFIGVTEKNIEIIGSSILKQKLKAIADKNNENDNIRLHRAISWLKCAEEHSDNIDVKFITLWISFNACYADNDNYNISLTEKVRFKAFLERLVKLDEDHQFFKLLWYKFAGPVRLLIDNQYAFKPFWDANRGEKIAWETYFKQSKIDSRNYLANQQVPELMGLVLDRLYTVRNQLIHGGATYQGKVNRSQVKDASEILSFLVPLMIDIMITNINEDWGTINYIVIE